ncbi:transporter substrate-binding domain-containing protein [Vogesella sp. GCM10023246]|uniref:Transporter substrate-binding domain-containing protein n=1 Tax=Vogesella oryzagri TaxID=3160864 RepID=A0ABV1M289_9NEIS
MRPLILLGCLLLSMLAHSAPLLTVTEDWPPYNTLLDPQQADGAYARVVRTALQRSGLPSGIQVYPWARSLAHTTLRPDTLVFALARTESRESQFIWVARLGEVAVYLWHEPGLNRNLHQARDCCSICAVRQDASEESILAAGFASSHLTQANNHADCLRLVRNGSIDYLVQSDPPLQMLLRQQGLAVDSLQRGPLLQRYTVYLAASRGTRPRVIRTLQRTLARMDASGESRKIITSTLKQAGIQP